MDLNEIKNRAKDLLADLTEPRPEREHRPGDDAGRDPAARTDRPDTHPGEPTPPDTHPGEPTPERAEQTTTGDRLDAEPPPAVSDRSHPTEPAPADSWVDPTEQAAPERSVPADPGPLLADPPASRAARDRTAEPDHHDVLAEPASRRTDDAAADVGADGLPADPERLVTADRAASYSARWDAVKGEFVDEPRRAVAQADALVGELLDELGQLFGQQRRGIEQDLDNDDEVSTEELRVALRRYRSFFDRLLSV